MYKVQHHTLVGGPCRLISFAWVRMLASQVRSQTLLQQTPGTQQRVLCSLPQAQPSPACLLWWKQGCLPASPCCPDTRMAPTSTGTSAQQPPGLAVHDHQSRSMQQQSHHACRPLVHVPCSLCCCMQCMHPSAMLAREAQRGPLS